MKNLALIDYGRGNIRSVAKALEAAGARPSFVTEPSQLEQAEAVVVPGQGAFGDCACSLRESGLWDPLIEWIKAGRPYLGICLGYQLLFESSEESPGTKGMGIFPGEVKRFASTELKIPHMGWNQLVSPTGDLFRQMPEQPFFYFVHSYYPAPADAALVSSYCDYGGRFAASISRGAVHATQFHPEKSQASGQALLHNFIATL